VIGEGGMGVVYRAEQAEPLCRAVALKVIKPGMDSDAVLARFDAERQALALMDHPNIARVLDAGATPAGRPYFVMELVEGVPVTDYCDTARLSPRDRLGLFLPVCAAVQHAHQKGIIHRDIKPSNVLVTVVDGRPVPKVIDFGVAKAVDPRRAAWTLFTRLGAVVGTPEYMSPEQAGAGPDVDTRTDVYSLGVLLYELLTGATPLDRETLRRAALDELLRRVREEEPPRPSTRLSATNDRLPSVAAVRATEPARLARLVRGDLDWVVMKALEKDRGRRYETPSAFARDLQRFLDGDPVEAGPPSRTYRLRRFARKHQAALATAAAFALVLTGATAVSAWEAWRAARAERSAERRLGEVRKANVATTAALTRAREAQEATGEALKQSEEDRDLADRVRGFLIMAFRSPDPDGQDGREIKVADLLGRAEQGLDDPRFTGSPKTRGELLEVLGEVNQGLGLNDRARVLFEKAHAARLAALGADHPDTVVSLANLAGAYIDDDKPAEAIRLCEEALERGTRAWRPDDPSFSPARANLARAYLRAGRVEEATRLFESALQRVEAHRGADPVHVIQIRSGLAEAYLATGRPGEAIRALDGPLREFERTLGLDHPAVVKARNNLATAYAKADRAADAARLLESVVRSEEARYGPDHPKTLVGRNNLALAYRALGRIDEATRLFESSLKAHEARYGLDHPETIVARNNLAAVYHSLRRLDRSVPLYEQGLRAQAAALGPDHPDTLFTQANLGVNYLEAGRPAEGARLLEDARRRARGRPAVLERLAVFVPELGAAYLATGRLGEAIRLLEPTLDLLESRLGPDHPATLSCLSNLAAAYWRAGRLDRSVVLFERAHRRCVSRFGPYHPETLKAQANLGINYRDSGRPAEGARLLEDALRGAADRPDVQAGLAWVRPEIAAAYVLSGRLADAESLYREALGQARQSFGPEDPQTAVALARLGHLLLKQARWSEAEPVLRASLSVCVKAELDAWRTLDIRSLLGGALLGQGRYAEAEPLVVSGYEGMKAREGTIPPVAMPRLTEAALRVVQLYESWGKPEQATAWKAKLGLDDLPADVFARP
jgi:tetratricopeptide (TPR) repeat protein